MTQITLKWVFVGVWTVFTLFVVRDFARSEARMSDLVRANRREHPKRFWAYMTFNALMLIFGWYLVASMMKAGQ